MTDICLVTLNSTYQHTAFGLRYLFANLKEYQSRARIFEYTIHKDAQDIAKLLLAENPQIIGFGVYIWNVRQTQKVIEHIKVQRPEVLIVLGGPEVSYEVSSQEICQIADYIICGEADFLFYDFCHQILGLQIKPPQKIISGPQPDINTITSPYAFFSDNDIKNRIIYVEASRGCPYKCEYCLSSLDQAVRNFPLSAFLADLQILMDRGARQFKFIDRTFNLSPTISTQIMQFFLDRLDLGLFLHFEMVPDRLPDELKALIKKFPPGSLQFEIGVQTLNPMVAQLVSRRQNVPKIEENLRFLKSQTGVHTHVDLIAGLPGEDLESFARGFDQLAKLEPDEIQVGILKRLKGTPIIRHEKPWEMTYSAEPPYAILKTRNFSESEICKMQRFSKFWDLIANSGNFVQTVQKIRETDSLFSWFWELTDYLTEKHPQAHSIHLLDLFRSLKDYFHLHDIQLDVELEVDYTKGRPGPVPHFLRTAQTKSQVKPKPSSDNIPKRQKKHLQPS